MPGARREGPNESARNPPPPKPAVPPGDASSKSAQQLDERLDEELEDTFPASDPLPWTHKSD
ncbi:MAG TPA: hypothetical protein VME21_04300 [Steroidobacteraceae bacterium]|nr:hypothetical protein [Steroidobacteraceae bacterium]